MFCTLCTVILTLLTASAFAQTGKPSAEETQKNVAVLQDLLKTEKPDDALLYAASQAIQKLTEVGTADAVPELKKILAVEQLNTVARTALINMPNSAGAAALLDSLHTLRGKNLAGVIESLGSIRDGHSVDALIKLTQNEDALIAKSAILALGKIATPDAVRTLQSILGIKQQKPMRENRRLNQQKITVQVNPKYKNEAAAGLLLAAERLLSIGNKQDAINIFETLQTADIPAVRKTAMQSVILFDEAKGMTSFLKLFKSNDKLDFKILLAVANQMQSPKTSQVILDHFGPLPNDNKAALLEVIGHRKDPNVIEPLLQFAKGDEPLTKIAAVKALGKIGDLKGLNVILSAAVSSDQDLAAAGNAALLQLQGKEFNAVIVKILGSSDKNIRLAALLVISGRSITEGKEAVTALFGDSDETIRIAAYGTFALIARQAGDLELLLTAYLKAVNENKSEAEQEALKVALKVLCEKTPERDGCAEIVGKLSDTGHLKAKLFLLELMPIIGGEKAGKAVVKAAKNTEEGVADKATEILGKWRSGEIAEDLYDIAKSHPVEKFRIRALRGYLRIIRQLSGAVPLGQRLEMTLKAEAIAVRDEEKTIVAEAKERFQKLLRGTPLFDGKTFAGWEFRGNEQWFRIEEGAIVAGSMQKKIPHNEFICTIKEYGDFTLRLEVKVLGGDDANAGVQFRSQRLPEDDEKCNEVVGYQADMTGTEKFWGSLYDESRRGKFLAEANGEEVKKLFRPNDWNELEIVCKGANVKIFLNGKQTIDYTETDAAIPKKGVIGLQIHQGRASEAWYRDICIEE
jgi:HEAT repeat protein